MGKNRYIYDKIIRNGTLSPIVASDYHPSYPPSKIQNIWTDYYYRSKYGAGSGWGYFEISANNKWFDFDEGAGELHAALTVGNYDATSLCTAVKVVLEAAGTHTYTVTYSDTSRKFTIQDGTGTVSFKWLTGLNAANSVGNTMGYSVTVDSPMQTVHAALYVRIHEKAGVEVLSLGSAAITTTGVALFGLNLTSSYQIFKLQRYTGSVWEDIGNFEYDSINKKAVIFFNQKSASRYRVVIRDWTNSLGYSQVGACILGDYVEVSRGYEYGAGLNVDDTSTHRYSKKGYLNVVQGFFQDLTVIEYEVMAEDEVKLEALYRLVGKRYPIAFVSNSDDAVNTLKYIIFNAIFGRREIDAFFKAISLAWEDVK